MQGKINATLERLDLKSRNELIAYAETLTEEQRRIGRQHLKTVRALTALKAVRKNRTNNKRK